MDFPQNQTAADQSALREHLEQAARAIQRGRASDALQLLARVTDLGLLDENYLYMRGLGRLKSGQVEAAIQDFSEAIRFNPKHASAYYHRGLARQQHGDPQSAVLDFSRAVILEPAHADAHHQLGRLYFSLGDRTRAREALQRSLATLNTNGDIWMLLARVNLEDNDRRQAIECLQRAHNCYSQAGLSEQAHDTAIKLARLSDSARRRRKRYINLMERLVAQEYERQIVDLPESILEAIDRTDVEAWALNRLPNHRYVTSREWARKLESTVSAEQRELIRRTVQEGIVAIHANHQPPKEAAIAGQ